MCVRACVRACMRVCVCVCVRLYVCVCVCVCVCEREKESVCHMVIVITCFIDEECSVITAVFITYACICF